MGPTEKQMLALLMRSRGMSLTEIAEFLGTSKQNVASLIKRGKQNIKKFEKMYKLMKACNAKSFLEFKRGDKLYDVAEKVMEEADKANIKLKGNVNDIVSFIKMEGLVEEGSLKEDHGIALSDDGTIVVLTGEPLETFRKLISVYLTVKNKGISGKG